VQAIQGIFDSFSQEVRAWSTPGTNMRPRLVAGTTHHAADLATLPTTRLAVDSRRGSRAQNSPSS
jgi:hypothetical protein